MSFIIIKLQGGLGNQMFQYALGQVLSQKWNKPVYYDVSFFELMLKSHETTRRDFQLNLFENNIALADKNVVSAFLNPGVIQHGFNKLNILKKTFYREHSLRFDSSVFELSPPVYIDGYWQSQAYFNAYEGLIRKQLTFKTPLNEQSQQLSDHLSTQKKTVSVHIRRGDYVEKVTTNDLHGTCSIGYYQKAIELIKSKITNPIFYFFSDDTDWVKQNLVPIVENANIVSHNTGADSWQDMALMSRCNHHIIANSSFSWWGAWLNPNMEKTVIAPQNWFNTKTDFFDDTDIVPKSWIKIAND